MWKITGLLLLGCAAEKPPLEVDFSDLAGVEQKSDKFSSRLRVLYEMGHAETRHHKYSGEPRYRGIELKVEHYERLVFDVRSNDGDAIAWLLDEDYRILKRNDDHEQATRDSRIRFFNDTSSDRWLTLVFSEYDEEPANFELERWAEPTW